MILRRKSASKTRAIGDRGERAAARYLALHGYRILERNWFFYRKEIDLIAKRFGTLVFCEVKTRTMEPNADSPYGRPADAVTREKQRNLALAARAYCRMIGWDAPFRMDILEVYLAPPKPGRAPKIRRLLHIKNAFFA